MGTKNKPGRFDCYANAEPDEPMFVLLARDPDAPAIVEAWAERRAERYHVSSPQTLEAIDVAVQMREWYRLNRLGKS